MISNTKFEMIKLSIVLFMCLSSAGIGYSVRPIIHVDESETEQSYDIDRFIYEGYYRGVPLVVFETSDEIAGLSEAFKDSRNFYLIGNDTIYLRSDYINDSGPGMVLRTIYHEYGHHIWFEVLSLYDKEKYIEICENTDGYVSKYAIEGGFYEDFAETYESYKVNPESVPISKLNFIFEIRQKYVEEV